MKSILILLVAALVVLAVGSGSGQAQTLTTLYDFCNATNYLACVNGDTPDHLIQGTDGNFYGGTDSGGTNDYGTFFKITPQGTLTTIYQYALTNGEFGGVDFDLELGGVFYGKELVGGSNHFGSIVTMTTEGTLTTIYQFSGTNGTPDGSYPERLMQLDDSTLIGTTIEGGTNNAGTVFKITTAGALTTLHQFSGTNGVADGSLPVLTVQNGSEFIGSTELGGTPGSTGTVFEITAAGAFNSIHQFTTAEGGLPIITIVNGSTFIGTTTSGGSNGFGTAFEMTSQGTVTTFYTFSGTNGVMDGSSPGLSSVHDSSGAYYGLTKDGGTNGAGLAFTLSTSGTLTPVYEFCSVSTNCLDGSSPDALANLVSGDFYGTTDSGGANDGGTVFKLAVNGSSGGGGGTGSCTYALSSPSASPSAAGGAATVGVTASNGCAWTAASNDSFITVTSGSSGSGNGTVHYTVASNTSSNAQVGTMTIAGETFTVTEAGTTSSSGGGCTFTLKASSVVIPAKGGSGTVSVKPEGKDCEWTAVSNDPFITITSGSSGTGNGTVKFTIPGNTNSTQLIGTMTIAGLNVTIAQVAGGCSYALSPKDEKVKDTGGTGKVAVTPNFTDCDWTAVSNNGFITVTAGASGAGKGTVSYIVATNATTVPLTGSITIGGETFAIDQAAAPCEFSLGDTAASFSSAGGTSNVTVTANGTNCTWKAVISGTFIQITSDTSGSGSGTVDYTVEANTKTATRKGTITVGKEKLTITQSGTGAP
jgi:uncharacterized repeat protein (TIGR03803 family)